MPKLFKKGEFFLIFFLLLGTLFIYRDFFLKNKIVFSSNLLASFYSPWATMKFPEFPNGIPNKPIGGNDQVRMFYPYRTFINESFQKGEFPLWNPYNFSGSPLFANFQSTVFYPLNIFYLIFPQIEVWSVLVIIQPFLGTLFMYLFLKQFIKDKSAVLLGSVAFGFSGFIISWSQENAVVAQSFLWTPLILLFIDKFIQYKNPKYFVLLVLALSIAVMTGHLQIIFYVFLLVFSYGIFRIFETKNKLQFFLFFLGAILLSFLLTAIQLFPSIEAFSESTRAASSIKTVLDNYLLPLRYFMTVLAPDIYGNPGSYNFFGKGFYQESVFYIGIIPLVFAILSLIKFKSEKIVKFFFCVAVISVLFGVRSFFTNWFYNQPIPLISTFTPSRIFILTSFSLAVLSAFGFSYFLEKGFKKTGKIIFAAVVILGLILGLFVLSNYLLLINPSNYFIKLLGSIFNSSIKFSNASIKISIRNIILPLFLLGAVLPLTFLQNKLRFSKYLIVLLVIFGQLYFLNKYAVIGERPLLYPDHFVFNDILQKQNNYERFLSFGLPVLGDVGLVKKVYSPDGIDPLFPKRYGQLVWATKNNGVFTKDIPRIEVNLSEYGENDSLAGNDRFLKLISLIGVSNVYNYEGSYTDSLKITKIFPPSVFQPLWKKDNWQAYQNLNALPRAFLADNYLIEKDPQKIIDLIFDKNTNLQKTVILEEEPKDFSKDLNNSTLSEAKILEYNPQKVLIKTNADSDKILFLSDNYYPGWQAEIDGIQTKIYRGDYAFRAVIVPKGEHEVSLIFRPNSFRYGIIISGLTLISLIIIFLLGNRKKSS